MQCPPRGADDKSQLRILFAGRFVEQKGVQLLPAIVRAVRPPAGSVYDLSIHGAGPYRPLLEALATNPPPGWRIRVDGPLPGLANALPKFDLVLMPSLYEGLGLTAVESLLAGVPVVATAAPGLTEVFPSDYPWLAPPDDADSFAKVLSRAIAERSRWGVTVATSADFARNRFDVSAMCRAYARLYADAVASPAPKTDRQHARSEP
jgi:glycosyltransferase involved in cell wall biosynthesis